jgi:hypothetical protein
MASIKLKGDTSGELTISAPAVAGTNTLTLPASTSTLATTAQTEAIYNSLGVRNLIINGDMRIDQRNAGASYTSSNANVYTLDRWLTFETGGVSSRFTIQQNAGSVTPPTGFTNYMGITSSVASAVTAGMIQSIAQKIEGFNASDLAWGTANAKTVTISFWVRSSLTGTFGGVLSNGAVNYSYPFTYTISAATTWEYKTVTIAGPTAGTWVTNNGAGPVLQFVIGTGSTYQGSAGSWSANGYYGVTGTVDVTGTNGATLYITGVQLEVGTEATPFEHRPYDMELARCQRYYYRLYDTATDANGRMIGTAFMWSTTGIRSFVTFPVTMRDLPSVEASNFTDAFSAYIASVPKYLPSLAVAFSGAASTRGCLVNGTVTVAATSGDSGYIRFESTSGAKLAFSAEL